MNAESLTRNALTMVAAGTLSPEEGADAIDGAIRTTCAMEGTGLDPDCPVWAQWARDVCPAPAAGSPAVARTLHIVEAMRSHPAQGRDNH